MNTVIDRNLLERLSALWPEDMGDDGSGRVGFKTHVRETVNALRAALAAPSKIGVPVVAWRICSPASTVNFTQKEKDAHRWAAEPDYAVSSLILLSDHIAALAAVTAERDKLRAERDRLLSDNASLRGSCKALGEENKRLKRENKRQGKTIAAMAAKEGE